MGALTVNGLNAYEAIIHMPRWGKWIADLAIDGTDASPILGQQVNLVQDGSGIKFTGTAVANRTAVSLDTVHAWVEGGAGGLSKILNGKAYQGVTGLTVVQDILNQAGETLDQTSQTGALGTSLNFWSYPTQSAAVALKSVVAGFSLVWRTLANGNVWIGSESWPTFSQADAVLLDPNPREQRNVYGVDAFQLVPGVTFGGSHVSYVEHAFDRSGLRTTAWFELS